MNKELKVGDWAYYLGKQAGGIDTGTWYKGVVGQIIDEAFGGYCWQFNKCGTMEAKCSNAKKAFRHATEEEIEIAKYGRRLTICDE